MPFFVLTRFGYEQLVEQIGKAPSPLLVNKGVLSPSELEQLRRSGVDVTDFSYLIDVNDPAGIAEVMHTIEEHHIGQRAWVEHISALPSR